MTASIGTAPLLLIFSTNHRLLTRALDGLSDAHFRTRAGERLRARLTSLSDAALADAAAGTPLPGVKTVAEQLGFFALHDSYHVGQLGYMRKALGYPSLVG